MCDVSITITANTAKTKKILRTAWDEYLREEENKKLNLIDYLHPEKDSGIDVWDENYYGDEESVIVGQHELSLHGQVKWRPDIDFLQYLVDQGLSVSCEYHSEESGFCGRWEDGKDVFYYDYEDLLPEGWANIERIVRGDDDQYKLLNSPVWERGELLRLMIEENNKTTFGVILEYEPYEFIVPELPEEFIDLAENTGEWLCLAKDITAKHKIKILMTGETRPDEAIVYADKEGNNFLHIVL